MHLSVIRASSTTRGIEQDHEWAAAIRAGDAAAFERLFRRYYEELVPFVLHYVKKPEIAEELVQDIFYNIWRSRHRWNPRGTLTAYLFGAARNNSLKYLKRRRVLVRLREDLGEWKLTASANPHRDVEHQDFKQALRHAIDALPARRRQVYLLSREQGLTYAEIAAVMNISVNTVENHMVKAMKSLRERLSTYL